MLANTIIMALALCITVTAIVFVIMCISSLVEALSGKQQQQGSPKFRVNEPALKGSL